MEKKAYVSVMENDGDIAKIRKVTFFMAHPLVSYTINYSAVRIIETWLNLLLRRTNSSKQRHFNSCSWTRIVIDTRKLVKYSKINTYVIDILKKVCKKAKTILTDSV